MALLVLSIAIFIWSAWQHELLVGHYIWDDPMIYNSIFQWFSVPALRTTVGQAYDLTLLISFLALILSNLAIWFWNDE
jgi:hypothetical protein